VSYFTTYWLILSNMQSAPNQNFGLSPEEFETLVRKLKTGDETLFEHIFRKHFDDCRRFLIFEKGVPQEDAYDLTIDTILEFRDLLIAGKIQYGNLRYLFTRIAFTDWLKRTGRKAPTIDIDDIPFSIADENSLDWDEDSHAALAKAWQMLERKCQEVLRLRYYENLQIQQIAEIREAKPNSVTQESKRCMAGLKQYFFENYTL
jgi:RNA polymerase sigma factor (sigma-70 family)